VTHQNTQTEKGLDSDNVLSGQACQGVTAEIKSVLIHALVRLWSLLVLFETLRRDFVIQIIKIKYCA
jgi:hypothetical protein